MANKKNANNNTTKANGKTNKKTNANGSMKQAVKNAINISKVRTGKVKFNAIRKGYGFIIDDETGEEIFFHHTGIKTGRIYKGFKNNDTVSFNLAPCEKGTEATNIVLELSEENTEETNSEEVEETTEETEEGQGE